MVATPALRSRSRTVSARSSLRRQPIVATPITQAYVMKSRSLATRRASCTSTVLGTSGLRVGTFGLWASRAGFERIHPVLLAYSKTFDNVDAYRELPAGVRARPHLS